MSRKNRIEAILKTHFQSECLMVEDESSNHSVPRGAESHFKVILVAKEFENVSRIARHRRINQLLAGELAAGLHALSLHLYTPEEWQKLQNIPQTPACLGGKHHDQ